VRFNNREHAARLLAERLQASYRGSHPLVVAVPRGAVPMAKIIAEALGGDLDVALVRKLGHPDQPELAIGAIDETGNAFLTEWAAEIDPKYIEAEKQRQLSILSERRARYTPWRAPVDPRGRIVIVVDDGIATGSTITAALRTVRAKQPKKLIGAVAVASAQAAEAMEHECDAMVCLYVSADFFAVGQFFSDFHQVSDQEVIEGLRAGEPRFFAAE
jgi:putative phosphoribosyl transferase